jgi:hypothetical protein
MTFTFVTDGPESALAQARRAAGDGRVPITLGAGERIFDGVTGLTFDIRHVRPTEHVVHMTLRPRRT